MVPLPPPLLLAADLAPVDTESWGMRRRAVGVNSARPRQVRQPPGEELLTLARMARPAPPPRVSEHHPQRDTSMFLLSLPHGSLVEVLQPAQLYNPFSPQVEGRLHAGEELQDPEPFAKNELRFPSGETLPRCWLDPSYSHPVLNSSR